MRKRLYFFQLISVVAIVGCLVLGFLYFRLWIEASVGTPLSGPTYIQADAPHSQTVEKLISRLRYSGYEDFMRSDVTLGIDFENGSWALRNLHRFDENGNILLYESGGNSYGICGDLAAYTYQNLKSFFPEDRYQIEFIQVVESTYFQDETGADHIILRIADLEAGKTGEHYNKVYILDPALRRYGSPDIFRDYRPIRNFSMREFLANQYPDSEFGVNWGPPIVINRRGIVSLFILKVDGKFDPDNFEIVISATRRYEFARNPLFSIRRKAGQTTYKETDYPIHKIMSADKYSRFKEKVRQFYLDLQGRIDAQMLIDTK